MDGFDTWEGLLEKLGPGYFVYHDYVNNIKVIDYKAKKETP